MNSFLCCQSDHYYAFSILAYLCLFHLFSFTFIVSFIFYMHFDFFFFFIETWKLSHWLFTQHLTYLGFFWRNRWLRNMFWLKLPETKHGPNILYLDLKCVVVTNANATFVPSYFGGKSLRFRRPPVFTRRDLTHLHVVQPVLNCVNKLKRWTAPMMSGPARYLGRISEVCGRAGDTFVTGNFCSDVPLKPAR